MATTRDIYQEVTDSIIEALETAGEWSRPWVDLGTDAALPRSIDGRPYRGANIFLLWASGMKHGYESGVWGTYKAWSSHGAQVRKGEHGTMVTLWKPVDRKATADEIAKGQADKRGRRQSLLLRSFTVFNAAQVDGYDAPVVERPEGPAAIAHAEAFFASVGANVVHADGGAFYAPFIDTISLPPLDTFNDAEHYYATSAHEHGHWTGAKSRLDRDFAGRFGTEAYAFEELVAELSAAFTGAHLGIGSTVRADHASYVKNWLKVLRDDKKAVFTAYLLNAAAEGNLADDFAGPCADLDVLTMEVAA